MMINAYAKINLHLDVTAKADNGYHKVITVMQSISLCDVISISFCDGDDIFLRCNVAELPTDRRNLAYRAAELLFERIGKRCGVLIEIDKRIPMAAGLAGGSTDAAAVLWGLNELLGKPLSNGELCELGAVLGADVPFCIAGGPKYADGIGEKLHPFWPMPKCFLLVACAGEGVSTPWAYAALDKKYGDFKEDCYKPHSTEPLCDSLKKQDLKALSSSIFNIFEEVISSERKMVNEIKRTLLENGALSAMMSGSGPSVFGIFDSKEDALFAAKILNDACIPAFVCEPVSERF